MKVTDEMVAAYVNASAPGRGSIRGGIQAVLDLLAPHDDSSCGRRQDGTLMCHPARECADCPLVVLGG